MKQKLLTFTVAALLLAASGVPSQALAQNVLPGFGGDRAGTSGFQFLEVTPDARSAALNQAVVTNAKDASALFWNPALAAKSPGNQIGFHHTLYHVDVTLDYLGGFYHWRGAGLTLGGYVQALNSGEMDVTDEYNQFGTGQTFRWTAIAGGLSVAQSLTDLFSYGLTAKLVRLGTLDLDATTLMADLGFSYRIGETGLEMAVAVRNFGLDTPLQGELKRVPPPSDDTDQIVEDDFADLTPPTTFLLGASYRAFRTSQSDLVVSGQLQNLNDNAESVHVSAEYTWAKLLMLRAGYRFARDSAAWPSLGVGLRVPGLPTRFDYSFNRHDYLGTVHRIGLNVSL